MLSTLNTAGVIVTLTSIEVLHQLITQTDDWVQRLPPCGAVKPGAFSLPGRTALMNHTILTSQNTIARLS